MAWAEIAANRTRQSRTYEGDTPGARKLVASMGPLHYDDNGTWADIDLTPQRVTNAQLDGWVTTNNGWTYALGQRNGAGADGWVGFGRRNHAFWFRLARYGYVRTTNLSFTDLGGAATYTRANLSSEASQHTFGPNADPITPKALAQWNAIWPGVNIRWALRGDRLKEEVILTSTARAALPAHTTPTNQTWFGWAYQVDWSDVPKRFLNGGEVAADADSGQITGAMELRTALDELIAFMPLDHAYVVTDPDDPFGRVKVNLRKRFYTQAGQPWLVVGLPVAELNGLPAGDIVFDPTFAEEVAAGADDATWVPATNFDAANTANIVGVTSSLSVHSFMRVDNVTIAAGATIDAAVINGIMATSASLTTVNSNIYLNDADDPAAPTTFGAAEALALTTAFTAWDNIGTWTAGNPVTTPDFTSAVQEVVDRGGWASGNAMIVIWRNDGSGNNRLRSMAAYDHATYAPPELDIDYTTSGPQTVETSAIASTLTLYNPSVVPGSVTITPDTRASTLALYEPSVAQIQSVSANAIGSTLALSQPSVTPGSVTVETNAIASTAALYNPTVTPPPQTVETNAIASALALSQPTVTPGAVTLTPDAIASTLEAHNPAVQAVLASEGPLSPGTLASDSSIGTIAWTNPGNAAASDNADATAAFTVVSESEYLKATNFGFAIPTGSTIQGIVVEAEIQASSTRIADNAIRLVKGGTISGDDNARSTSFSWPAADAYVTWGGTSDLWGLSWGVSDINASTFGVAISAKEFSGPASVTAAVDHIRITVHYSTPATQTIATNAIASTLALYDPTATPGTATVVANAIASTLALYDPTVVPDQLVLANAIGSTLALYTPSVVYDQTAVMQTIASTLALYDPTVANAGTVAMETIASTLALYQPTVTPGAVTVAANAIASTLALSQPSVTPGAVTVATNAISSTLTVYQLSDVTHAAVIEMQAVASTLVVYLLDVDGGVAIVAYQLTATGSLPVYTAIASLPDYTATGSAPGHTARGSTT